MFGRNNGLFNAGFLSRRDTKRLLSTRFNGLCVNGKHHLSLENSFRHLLVVGSTGSGKSTTMLIPSLLNLKHSAVVTDPSGEIFAQTSGYLQSQGFNIMTINLVNFSQSLNYNPISRVKTPTDARKVAHLLVKSAFPQSNGKDTFWNVGATNIIAIFIKLLLSQPMKYRNLGNVKFLLDSFGTGGAGLINFVANNADTDTFREYKSFAAQSDSVLQSTLSTAKVALEKLSDPELAQLTSCNNVDFGELRSQKSVLYLIVAEQSLEYYAFILSLIYAQIFDQVMQPSKSQVNYHPIFFLLDEFANSGIGLLDNFNTIITTIRKKACSVTMVVQNLQQIVGMFGPAKAASIIDGGCATHLFLSGQSQLSAELLERRLGKTTMGHENPQGRSLETARALMTADEIVQLPKDQSLLFHANYKAVLLKMRPFYLQKELKRRAAMSPAVLSNATSLNPIEYVPL